MNLDYRLIDTYVDVFVRRVDLYFGVCRDNFELNDSYKLHEAGETKCTESISWIVPVHFVNHSKYLT